MGFFDKNDTENEQEPNLTAEEQETPVKKIRKPYATWEVGGEVYKLRLTTELIIELEGRYKTNLMNIMGEGQGGMPALKVMLDVTQVAMRPYQHGIKQQDVMDIFNRYMNEGGSQLEFYTSVYMPIFAVSGFFSQSVADQMTDSLQKAQEEM